MFALLFLCFLLLSLRDIRGIDSFIKSSFSEFPVYNFSSTNSFLPNYLEIQIDPLPKDKFILSWLECDSTSFQSSIKTQVFDSNTGKPLVNPPIVTNDSNYTSPLIARELSFPEDGIMTFRAQKRANDTKYRFLVESFYFSSPERNNLGAEMNVEYNIDEEFARSYGKQSFKAKFINNSYDGFYVVAYMREENISNSIFFRIAARIVKINLSWNESEMLLSGSYENITSFFILPLERNGFMLVFVALVNGKYILNSQIFTFRKYSLISVSKLLTVVDYDNNIWITSIFPVNIKNLTKGTNETELYYLLIWETSGLSAQLINPLGEKFGEALQIMSQNVGLTMVSPINDDSVIFFFEYDLLLFGTEILSSQTYYQTIQIAIQGSNPIVQKNGILDSFIHSNGMLQKILTVHKRDLLLLIFSNNSNVFGKYLNLDSSKNCLVYDNSTKECEQCIDGYFLGNNHLSCFQEIEYCSSYSLLTGQCEICNSSSYCLNLQKTICVRKIENCQDYTNSGHCINCLQGYSLSVNGFNCSPTIRECLQYCDTGDCCYCNVGLHPISKNTSTQCLSLNDIAVFGGGFENFKRHFLVSYIFATRQVVSWIQRDNNTSLVSAKMILLEVAYDRFLWNSNSILKGDERAIAFYKNDNSSSYFFQQNNQEIIYPIQTLSFLNDRLMIYALWSVYQHSEYVLYLAKVYLDRRPPEKFIVSETPMLIDDFQIIGDSHSMKKMSNGFIVVFWTVQDSINNVLSFQVAVYNTSDTTFTNPFATFNISNQVREEDKFMFGLEVLDNDCIVIYYLLSKDSREYIMVETFTLYQGRKFDAIANLTIGNFFYGEIKSLQALKKSNNFVLFWQNETVSYQEFDFLCQNLTDQEVIMRKNSSEAVKVFSIISGCVLADGRLVLVWANSSPRMSIDGFYLVKIEGDEMLHPIIQNLGTNPQVICKEELNEEDQSSSFTISWNETFRGVGGAEYNKMSIFVAKKIMGCEEYDDSLRSCNKCSKDRRDFIDDFNNTLCWKEIPGCSSFNNNNGVCEQCGQNLVLIDANGNKAVSPEAGIVCVVNINDCRQYDMTTPNFDCLTCSYNFVIVQDTCYRKIPNCQTQTNDVICENCYDGFTKQNNSCFKNIDNCEILSVDSCTQCQHGFSATENNLNCALSVDFCAKYSSVNLACSGCIDDYVLYKGECENAFLLLLLAVCFSGFCLLFLGFLFRIVYVYYRTKKLEKRDEFNLGNCILEEETVKKRPMIMRESLLEHNSDRFYEFIHQLKQSNNIYCYEILDNNQDFTSYFQLKKLKFLGEGGVGEVWEVFDKQNKHFALKIFIKETKHYQDILFDDFSSMVKEYGILANLREGIINVFGVAYSDINGSMSLGIVLELMEQDLLEFLKANAHLTLESRFNIGLQIAKAFLYIHGKDYVHHDIKLKNILIKRKAIDQYEVKISDFGTCLKSNPFQTGRNNKILTGITELYSSPENLLHCSFKMKFENDKRSDIWSLAVVFYKIFVELKHLVFPWTHLLRPGSKKQKKNVKLEILKEKQKKNKYIKKEKKKDIPEELIELLNDCLQVDFEKRPFIEDFLERLLKINDDFSSKRNHSWDNTSLSSIGLINN